MHLKMSKRSSQPRQSELESANQEERNTELERVHWLFTSMKMLNYLRLSEVLYLNYLDVPGVEVVNVTRLNLLQLAPGGQLGRFVIWT